MDRKAKRASEVAAFLRLPTKEQWKLELDRFGWSGPDGSSASTDNIGGLRIGNTSRAYKYAKLPANHHDWMYQQGRRKRIPKRLRRAADKSYRDECLAVVSVLIGYAGWKARRRCHFRFRVLRMVGWRAWKTRD